MTDSNTTELVVINQPSSGLLLILLVNLFVGALVICLFSKFATKKFRRWVGAYSTKDFAAGIEPLDSDGARLSVGTELSEDAYLDVLNGEIEKELKGFRWIWYSLRHITLSDIQRECGDQALTYLSVLKSLFFFLAILLIVSLSVALPLNLSGRGEWIYLNVSSDEPGNASAIDDAWNLTDFAHTTVGNVLGENDKLWGHVFLIYVATFLYMLFLYGVSGRLLINAVSFSPKGMKGDFVHDKRASRQLDKTVTEDIEAALASLEKMSATVKTPERQRSLTVRTQNVRKRMNIARIKKEAALRTILVRQIPMEHATALYLKQQFEAQFGYGSVFHVVLIRDRSVYLSMVERRMQLASTLLYYLHEEQRWRDFLSSHRNFQCTSVCPYTPLCGLNQLCCRHSYCMNCHSRLQHKCVELRRELAEVEGRLVSIAKHGCESNSTIGSAFITFYDRHTLHEVLNYFSREYNFLSVIPLLGHTALSRALSRAIRWLIRRLPKFVLKKIGTRRRESVMKHIAEEGRGRFVLTSSTSDKVRMERSLSKAETKRKRAKAVRIVLNDDVKTVEAERKAKLLDGDSCQDAPHADNVDVANDIAIECDKSIVPDATNETEAVESVLQALETSDSEGTGVAIPITPERTEVEGSQPAQRALLGSPSGRGRSNALRSLDDELVAFDRDAFQEEDLRWVELEQYSVRKAPAPGNVMWENLGVSDTVQGLRSLFVNVVLLVLVFFLSSPLAILESAKTFLTITEVSDDLERVVQESKFINFVVEYLPSFLLFLVKILLPRLVVRSAVFERPADAAGLQYLVMKRYFIYALLAFLVMPSFAQVSVSILINFLTTEEGFSSTVRNIFLPNQGAFFLGYLMQVSLLGVSFKLMRFDDRFIDLINLEKNRALLRGETKKSKSKATFVSDSESDDPATSHEKRVVVEQPEFHYPREYVNVFSVLSITIVYGMFAPLILLFGVLFVGYKYVVDKYNIAFVNHIPLPEDDWDELVGDAQKKGPQVQGAQDQFKLLKRKLRRRSPYMPLKMRKRMYIASYNCDPKILKLLYGFLIAIIFTYHAFSLGFYYGNGLRSHMYAVLPCPIFVGLWVTYMSVRKRFYTDYYSAPTEYVLPFDQKIREEDRSLRFSLIARVVQCIQVGLQYAYVPGHKETTVREDDDFEDQMDSIGSSAVILGRYHKMCYQELS